MLNVKPIRSSGNGLSDPVDRLPIVQILVSSCCQARTARHMEGPIS